MILLSLFTTGFVDYDQNCSVGVIGLGGKFNSAVSLPAIDVNLGKTESCSHCLYVKSSASLNKKTYF
jgi:hypothetical protein